MARNIVPPDGATNLTIGTKVKRWLKGFFAGLDVSNGANAPVNTLQRSTTYAVGDVVQSDAVHAKHFLKCTTAGTTGSAEPNFTGVTSGSTVTDGTAVWTVKTFGSEEALDDYLPLSGGTLTGALAGTDAEFSGDVTSGSVSAAMADISNTNKAPINTLQRDTEYAVGDVLYTSELHAKFFLKCTTAGTTGETEPDFTGVGGGDTVTDGTAEFTVQTILSLEEKEAAFVDDLIAALQTTGSLPSGTAFSTATLLSKMIANMNTEDGVQYNFSNANAWYICLGAKYGGLIIQGGLVNYPANSQSITITYPLSQSICMWFIPGQRWALAQGTMTNIVYDYGILNANQMQVTMKIVYGSGTSRSYPSGDLGVTYLAIGKA